MKPLVYLAAPFTSPNPMHNTTRAVREAGLIHAATRSRVVVFVPHLSVLWDMIEPQDYESWLNYDLVMVEHCEALYRMRGESPGADREVKHAESLNIPVFLTRSELIDWAYEVVR